MKERKKRRIGSEEKRNRKEKPRKAPVNSARTAAAEGGYPTLSPDSPNLESQAGFRV